MASWWRAGRWTVVLGLVVGLGGSFACSDDTGSPASNSQTASNPQAASGSAAESAPTKSAASAAEAPAAEDTRSEKELIEAGRGVYNANCIACHNMDPARDGALGPAVAGSSYALLEARVLRAQYPPGYEPKRDTRVMVPLRHLGPQIKALTAYLDSK